MTWTRSTNAGYDAAGTTHGRYLGRVKERAEELGEIGEDVCSRGLLKSSVVAARKYTYSKVTFQGPFSTQTTFGQGSLVASRGVLGPILES